MYAVLVLALGALPQSTLALPQSTLAVMPADGWHPDPRYAHVNRWAGGVIVGSWFPGERVYRSYNAVARTWGTPDPAGPRPALPPQVTVPAPQVTAVIVPPGHHAHRATDGRVIIHGDWNHGDPAAHAGVPYPWPKVAFPGQAVICPGGR